MNSNKPLEHFVTLFDSNFLPQGLALHLSLNRCFKESYKLWILCLDDQVFDFLKIFNLNNVELLKLSELETPELLIAKSTRTLREYYWTLTPFTFSFVFQSDSDINRVTYLDADTWLLQEPTKIFTEFNRSKKSILITEHAYAIEHDQSQESGKYCVQFVTFTRGDGEKVRQWWQERCLEWCYARHEEGKFGDQKYLENFLELFPESVHVVEELSSFMAPWNATRFPHENAVLWHFHGLRIIKFFGSIRIYLGDYKLPENVIRDIYQIYIDDLMKALILMKQNSVTVPVQQKFNFKMSTKYLLSKFFNKENFFPYKNIINLKRNYTKDLY